MKNLASFSTKDGDYSGLDAAGTGLGQAQTEPFKIYLDLGIDAWFTGIFKF